MDFVPIVNGLTANAAAVGDVASAEFGPLLEFIKSNAVTMITFGVFIAFVFGFIRKIWSRLSRSVEDTMFSNWRLALLGATALVLSLASGWTTWDGMKNFTGEPTLSLMITFGIQGVMLIVAWLIGESFATGMHQRGSDRAKQVAGIVGGIVAALVIVAATFALFFMGSLPFSSEALLFAVVGVGIVALIAFVQWDLLQPYLQSSRIIMRNAVLWVMFLACMATSVFFSFDSLFANIFPASERARAAQLRAQNQVSGIVADIGQTIATRRLVEAETLFSTDGWKAYENHLDNLTGQAQGAQQLIERYFVEQMEARREAVEKQRERITSSESSQAGLVTKKIGLTDEIGRLLAERPEAVTRVGEQQRIIDGLEKRLDEQRALTLAEERGVEGSGKEGRGQFWRASKLQEKRIQAEIEVARKRLSSPQGRLTQIDQRIATIKGELAEVEGALAKLKGVAQTANKRIAVVARASEQEGAAENIDPSRVLPAFEKAKAAFRQNPTEARLNALHDQCTLLRNAMLSTPATKERVRGIDCDPKQASEAASNIFALNVGVRAFGKNCSGGDKINAIGTTDGLFGFARQCLSDSGLASKSTEQLRTKINFAELNRDDRAHRFVVTWNAFQDGNRLAFLALSIAIAIDSLVFMSGLFGANAVRSPLQDVPSLKPRSATQLEAIIENALLPDKFNNAHATIEAMQPITPIDGYTQEVVVPFDETPDRARILKVLNAGAAIGAVARDPVRPERYLVRPELFEFLSHTAKTCFEREKGLAEIAELRQVTIVALRPYVGDHAEIVLNNMHPINEKNECTSEVELDEVPEEDKGIIRKVLNAGTTMGYAQKDDRKGEGSRYYIHKELFKTLSLIAATVPKQGKRAGAHAQIAGPVSDAAMAVRDGGVLTQRSHQVAQEATAAPSAQLTQRVRETGERVRAGSERLDASQADVDQGAKTPAASPMPGETHAVDPLELERFYRDELFDVFELRRGVDREHILAGDALSYQAAQEAWKALEERASENAILRDYIHQFRQDLQTRLKARYFELEKGADNNSQETNALQSVRSRMHAAWSVLMLHPETGLIQSLISRLDDAASNDGSLSSEDSDLRNRLTKAQVALHAGKLGDAQTWRRVESAIAEIAQPAGNNDLPNIITDRGNGENVVPLKGHPNGTNG